MGNKIENKINPSISIIARYTFSGIIIVTIIQKIFDPNQFENLANFVSLISILLFESILLDISFIFYGIILIEFAIIFSLYSEIHFKTSIQCGILLLLSGATASLVPIYYGLQSNCGCGLFGENPYLLLFQKLFLLGLLIFIWKNKHYYFEANTT